jgi:transposase
MVSILPNKPAASLDMNPIENVWNILKKRGRDARPQIKEQLINIILHASNEPEMDRISHLIESVPIRLAPIAGKQRYGILY